MNFWTIIGGAFLIYVIAAGFDQCSHREDNAARPRRPASVRPVVRSAGPVSESRTAIADAPARPRVSRPRIGDAASLIVSVGDEFNVPAGALYGIWMKESGGLKGGWGQGQGWLSAAALSGQGSECYQHYKAGRCEGWWSALQAICGQKRGGQPICDPAEVRTSYAFAMGPMQHLPSLVAVRQKDGSYRLGAHTVDYDGDGVVDPHDLGDAMASTAKLIRKYYEEEGSWPRAVNRYYGSQKAGYYSGTFERLGVFDHWKNWCVHTGRCRAQKQVAYASN